MYYKPMNTLILKIKRLGRQIRGLFPTPIPVGMSEFNIWAQNIIDTYPLPTQDSDSVKFTLTSIIMHLGPSDAYKSSFYFYLRLKAGAAKQIAGAVFYDIKSKHDEARKLAEATAKTVANEPQI